MDVACAQRGRVVRADSGRKRVHGLVLMGMPFTSEVVGECETGIAVEGNVMHPTLVALVGAASTGGRRGGGMFVRHYWYGEYVDFVGSFHGLSCCCLCI